MIEKLYLSDNNFYFHYKCSRDYYTCDCSHQIILMGELSCVAQTRESNLEDCISKFEEKLCISHNYKMVSNPNSNIIKAFYEFVNYLKNEIKNIDMEKKLPINPCEVIKAKLNFCGMTKKEFSLRMGEKIHTINKLFGGEMPINLELAKKLEFVLGNNAQYWLNLQAKYDELVKGEKNY